MRPRAPHEDGFHGDGLLNLLPDPVISLDLDRYIASWNRAAEIAYGFSAAEALGKRPAELLGTRFPTPLGELLETLADTGRWQGNLTVRAKDGTELTVESRWAARYDGQGKLTGAVAIDRDITIRGEDRAEHDLREAAAERDRLHGHSRRAERLESAGQLAGVVAHDFNNLLAIIMNYGALLSSELKAEHLSSGDERWAALLEDLGEIDKAASRAALLTDQLLAFSRQEVGAG